MAQLPDLSLAARPVPRPSQGIARMQTTTGFEGIPAQVAQQVANSVSQLSDTLYRVKDQQDTLVAESAYNQLLQRKSELEFGDNGYNTVTGSNAISPEFRPRYTEDFSRSVDEISAGLHNDNQRSKFQSRADMASTSFQDGLLRHSANESLNFAAQTAQATVDLIINDIASNPENWQAKTMRGMNVIDLAAQQTGEPPEATAIKKQVATDNIFTALIGSALADHNVAQAREYFADIGDAVSVDTREQAEQAIRTVSIRGESQAKADELVATKTRREALAEARSIEDAELRDETVRRVNVRFNEIEAIESEQKQQNIDGAVEIISNDGSLDDIDPVVWNSFSQEERSQLRALDARGEWYQDDAKWYEFVQLSTQEVADMNLYTELRPYVDDQHWDRALALQAAAKGPQNSVALTNTITFQQRFQNSLQGTVFGDVKALTGVDASRYARMENEASMRLEVLEIEAGRKLTGSEMQDQVFDPMIRETVNLDEWGRDPTIPASAVLEDDRGNAYVPISDISAADASSIENIIISNSRRPSRDKIQRAYAAMLINDRALFDRIVSE